MRRLFRTGEALAAGLTMDALRWGERTGKWRRLRRGVYAKGPEEPTPLDQARGVLLATGGVATGLFAGVLHGLDSVELAGPDVTVSRNTSGRARGVRRRRLDPTHVVEVDGIRCSDGLQTLVDLAGLLDDARWEQALESALRKRLVAVGDFDDLSPRTRGTARIRRVLALRPEGAPPTESLLETLMVQLVRGVSGVAVPERQVDVFDEHGNFVARVDLAWPLLGLFIELDGQHHEGQPVYDARRETAVVAATGWLCGRFTWTEVVWYPRSTARRLAALARQARLRSGVAVRLNGDG